ncbi:hypothetical protein STRTUCAR8_05747, partial [Streptomyces turgidiscabies Car8]
MRNGLGDLLRHLLGNLLSLDALCRDGLTGERLAGDGLRDRLPERRLRGKPLRGNRLSGHRLGDLGGLRRRNRLSGHRLRLRRYAALRSGSGLNRSRLHGSRLAGNPARRHGARLLRGLARTAAAGRSGGGMRLGRGVVVVGIVREPVMTATVVEPVADRPDGPAGHHRGGLVRPVGLGRRQREHRTGARLLRDTALGRRRQCPAPTPGRLPVRA